MRTARLTLVLVGTVLAASSAAQDTRREVAPHVHGTGRLNIVIENNKVSLELDTPAHDIVGFEHAPKTPELTAVVEHAIAKLKNAASIFRMSAEAGCTLAKAEAGLEQPDASAPAAEEVKSEEHANFNGAFEFECTTIGKLNSIDLGYFAAFPEASKLDIMIVTAKDQVTREATRDAPRLDLTGLN